MEHGLSGQGAQVHLHRRGGLPFRPGAGIRNHRPQGHRQRSGFPRRRFLPPRGDSGTRPGLRPHDRASDLPLRHVHAREVRSQPGLGWAAAGATARERDENRFETGFEVEGLPQPPGRTVRKAFRRELLPAHHLGHGSFRPGGPLRIAGQGLRAVPGRVPAGGPVVGLAFLPGTDAGAGPRAAEPEEDRLRGGAGFPLRPRRVPAGSGEPVPGDQRVPGEAGL